MYKLGITCQCVSAWVEFKIFLLSSQSQNEIFSSGTEVETFIALLWTDGRYFLQAVDQLDCNWQMMRIGLDVSLVSWLSQSGPGNVAGADPNLLGAGDWLDWREQMEKGEVELRATTENVIDNIWTSENGRPPLEFKVSNTYS